MNRRKSHADENFTWTGFRFRQFLYGKDVVGVAGAVKNKCFHKCSPLSQRRMEPVPIDVSVYAPI